MQFVEQVEHIEHRPVRIERDDQCGGGDRDDDGRVGIAQHAPSRDAHQRARGQRTPSGAVHARDGRRGGPPLRRRGDDGHAEHGSRAGVAQCTYNLSVGSQGLQVSIETLNAYASNPAYIFPAPSSTIPGLGDLAVIETSNTNERRITVKLGTNAIQVTVDFYTKPVDDAFVTQLAKDAVGRG